MRVFSGIQPTAQIHIGNYLGALRQFLKFQEKEECFFSIVDLHAITIPYEPKNLKKNVLETLIAFLAVGIDPKKSTIFLQSQVKEHTELAWLLGTITPVGDLFRMTQYKEKSKQFKGRVGAGILNYPILMAADILLYKAEIVPVGEDQLQHLELTREIARRFNKKFGPTFPLPKAYLPSSGAKIMSLTNPLQKMSKSLPDGCLFIFDSPKEIKRKILRAVTDSETKIIFDPEKKPGISNLLTIFSEISGKSIKEIEENFKNSNYENFKKTLANLLIEYFKPFREKREKLLKRPSFLFKVLEKGRKRAKEIASLTIQEVKEKMGFFKNNE
jgi:tryptophanyl-tRNA synthetase